MELTMLTILSVALVAIILFLLYRLRMILIKTPGAGTKMNTKELITNWQENKQKEAQYQNDLKMKARDAVKPQIEKILVDRYKQEAIDEATKPKAVQFAEKLGVNSNDFFSKDKVDRMLGNKDHSIKPGVKSEDIFSEDRISRLAGKGVNNDRLKDAAHSDIDYDSGLRKALKNNHSVDIDDILNKKR